MITKMTLISAFFFLAVSNASGLGFINNPDRYPSVGVSLGLTNIDGSFKNFSGLNTPSPGVIGSNSEIKTRDFTIDLRLPVSHELTLFGGVSVLKEESLIDNQGFGFRDRNNVSGFGFRIGARYYFNR